MVYFAGSIGRTELPRGHQSDLIDSITKKLGLLERRFYLFQSWTVSHLGHKKKTMAFVTEFNLNQALSTPLVN
jgi:hypothetical protein